MSQQYLLKSKALGTWRRRDSVRSAASLVGPAVLWTSAATLGTSAGRWLVHTPGHAAHMQRKTCTSLSSKLAIIFYNSLLGFSVLHESFP